MLESFALAPEVSQPHLRVIDPTWSDAATSDVLDDPRAWNLGRSRAADAVAPLDLADGPTGPDDECAGVWAAFGE